MSDCIYTGGKSVREYVYEKVGKTKEESLRAFAKRIEESEKFWRYKRDYRCDPRLQHLELPPLHECLRRTQDER